MMNDEFEYINKLLDFYDKLLTEKQLNIMDLYYRENYSLSEIAENLHITRSAVQDTVKRVVKMLKNYESKLELVEKFNNRSKIYTELLSSEDKQLKNIVELLLETE